MIIDHESASAPETMRAVIHESFGAPEVLQMSRVPRPTPLPTEVLVRVHAIGLNPVDWKTRAGNGVPGVLTPPLILGWDVSGVVEAVGHGVHLWKPGDEVFGMPWFPRAACGYAEFLTAPSRHFALKPAALDHVHAAALPLAALTAWQALVDAAGVQEGQRVLIHAASGGVGHVAVQIARHLGAWVAGTASSDTHAWLYALGANALVDDATASFESVVGDVDVVVDLIGGSRPDIAVRSLSVMRAGGTLVTVAPGASADVVTQAQRRGARVQPFLVEPDGVALARIGALIDDGELAVYVREVFGFEEIATAHRRGEAGHLRGKLVVDLCR